MIRSIEAHGPTPLDRAAAAFLLSLMAAGCLALWIGIPIGVLWLAGKVTADPAQHVLLSIPSVPLAMILWARGLFWIDRLYMRVTAGAPARELDPDDEPTAPRWLRGPLEPLLVVTLMFALIALFFWFFVLAEDPGAWVF